MMDMEDTFGFDHDTGLARDNVNVLKMAICFNRLDIVKTLLGYGIDSNYEKLDYDYDKDGESPLHLAVEMGNLDIIDLLIGTGININNKFCYSGHTPLHIAVKRDTRYDIVDMLLKNGADPSIKNDNNETVLHIAVKNENNAMVDMLLKYSPDLEPRDCYGFTPLYNAIMKKNSYITKCLLDKGASANAMCDKGCSVLLMAVSRCGADIVNLLLEHGADTCYMYTYMNSTPLTWFCHCEGSEKNCDITESLISYMTMAYHFDKKIGSLPGFKMNQEFIKNSPQLYSYKLKCEKEIETMCNTMVNHGISMLDSIRTGNQNNCNILARCVESLSDKLSNGKFDIYKRFINKYLVIGSRRKNILELAAKKLVQNFWFLPSEIIYFIAEKIDSDTLELMYE
ncbi:ankyrin repeat family protein [Turkeypox virus]|uniref:Ankyrin repeat family protein n=1 Tax=Turkeypox virus TaxID=336486 RepID=A0A0M3ZRL8_9POXV|nr:ankyrin repeat family protein [Turkeypox virus]ALA62384.1 ankyrin repeat family protein [Turkeypox virus]